MQLIIQKLFQILIKLGKCFGLSFQPSINQKMLRDLMLDELRIKLTRYAKIRCGWWRITNSVKRNRLLDVTKHERPDTFVMVSYNGTITNNDYF